MPRHCLRLGLSASLGVAAACLMSAGVTAQGRGRGAGPNTAASSAPTPRTADGHPDLSGRWGGGGGGRGGTFDAQGNYIQPRAERKGSPVNMERDSGLAQRFLSNVPMYKPQYWDKVDYLDVNGNVEDSNFHCMPAGVPRMGAPTRILQTATDLVFLYNQKNTFRTIPIDGRPHDPVNSHDQTYMGDSVGHWEGDTMVIDVVGFNDETWLAWPGYFHTNTMRVIERLTRVGNTLKYEVTVEDPDVLMKPWVMDPRTLNLNTNKVTPVEDPPCLETDSGNLYTKERG